MERDNKMSENKYLPIGTKIANKYEIVDILGEDEFELLYLTKAIGRKGNFFVLKELFLESFSFREQQYVSTVVEARGVFNKRKKQIIEEINSQKKNAQYNEIKIYGYEEENDTIYTIMGYSSNASIEKYLHFTPKENTVLPELKNLKKQDTRQFNKTPFIIGGVALLLGAVSFYGYEYLSKSQDVNEFIKSKEVSLKTHPPLQEHQMVKKEVMPIVQDKQEKIKVVAKVENLPIVEANSSGVKDVIQEKKPEPITKVEHLSQKKSISKEENLSIVQNIVLPEKSVNKTPPVVKSDVLKMPVVPPAISIETKIKNFLDAYMKSTSSADASATLVYYDKRLKRYFRFKNASHKRILKSQKIYNKKWHHRDFEISDFKIVKKYQRHNIDYYDVKTTTIWHVSNAKGKKLSGKSRGFMTLKSIDDTFKITTIYASK